MGNLRCGVMVLLSLYAMSSQADSPRSYFNQLQQQITQENLQSPNPPNTSFQGAAAEGQAKVEQEQQSSEQNAQDEERKQDIKLEEKLLPQTTGEEEEEGPDPSVNVEKANPSTPDQLEQLQAPEPAEPDHAE